MGFADLPRLKSSCYEWNSTGCIGLTCLTICFFMTCMRLLGKNFKQIFCSRVSWSSYIGTFMRYRFEKSKSVKKVCAFNSWMEL